MFIDTEIRQSSCLVAELTIINANLSKNTKSYYRPKSYENISLEIVLFVI